jgi:hypothetical protein
VLIAQLQSDLYLQSCNLLCVAPLGFGLRLVVLAICSVFPHWVLGFGFRSVLFFLVGFWVMVLNLLCFSSVGSAKLGNLGYGGCWAWIMGWCCCLSIGSSSLPPREMPEPS